MWSVKKLWKRPEEKRPIIEPIEPGGFDDLEGKSKIAPVLLADLEISDWFAAHVKREFPRLAVGAILGDYHSPGKFRAFALPNLSRTPLETYEIDPVDLLRVDRAARQDGLDILGIVYSRAPERPALPSDISRTNSAPFYLFWIAAVDPSGDVTENGVYVFDSAQIEDRKLASRIVRPNPNAKEFSYQSVVTAECVQAANEELMRWLAKHPDDLHRVHPGTFELIVAEIFRSHGYDVEVLGQWNQSDGGIDILAVRKDTAVGEFRIGIQCKRYTKTATVRADLIWALEGRLDKFHLHKGVLATTARFEKSVLREAPQHLWRIELKDFERLRLDIETWGHFTPDHRTGLWLPK